MSDDAGVHVGRLIPSEWLGREVHVVVDRPMGSRHPTSGLRDELNHGFVPGLIAPDGEELDAYVLGPAGPVDSFAGQVIGVVLRRDDVEDKLVVAAAAGGDAESIAAAIRFQEQFFDSVVVTADGA